MPSSSTLGSSSRAQQGLSHICLRASPPCIDAPFTSYDYKTNSLPPDVTSQTANIISTISATLSDAGATPADIVRVRYILPDRSDFPTIWPLLREFFGPAKPAATMVQASLMEAAMKVEIEVTAMIGAGGDVPPPA